MKKKLTIGILAHVDAGKTTLSEALLYRSGRIRTLGRVDHKNTYLDTDKLERERGITIFSKQARFSTDDCDFILLDTPGHVDFSPETERTLSLLDYAILVISGSDGVQNHTRTLWQLLDFYRVPTFIFVNKSDIAIKLKEELEAEIKSELSEKCAAFYESEKKCELDERLAAVNEDLLELFASDTPIDECEISSLIARRELFPCLFGSALRLEGVDFLLDAIDRYTLPPIYNTDQLGAKIYKIAKAGSARLTYMKITSGALSVRDEISYLAADGKLYREKISQIRLYSADKFDQADSVEAGEICAVVGLSATYVGQGLGCEENSSAPLLEPILTYSIKFDGSVDPRLAYPKLRELEEEEPSFHVRWNSETSEIEVSLMGDVQTDLLRHMISERFSMDVSFENGSILYKETAKKRALGVGHFEPLRHYAEVQLIIEPQPKGTGLIFDADVSEDELATNWQRLVLSHLYEKNHRGTLIGAELTDTKITLVAGRAHVKHTEGGDFREATLRAVRHGLMRAGCTLLEPYYKFTLKLPSYALGRALSDLEMRCAEFVITHSDESTATIEGKAPVATLGDYSRELISFTRGEGVIACSFDGYYPCHNQDEIVAASAYAPEADLQNPPHSVFCAQGAGFVVPWHEVENYKHIDYEPKRISADSALPSVARLSKKYNVSHEELEALMLKEFGPISRRVYSEPRRNAAPSSEKHKKPKPTATRKKSVIIDGYNLIYAWDDLKELADFSLEKARETLIDILSNYVAYTKTEVILVFDAYLVKTADAREFERDGLRVVYTKQDQTADAFIERLMFELGPNYDIKVVTGDQLIQFSAVRSGILRTTANEFKDELISVGNEITSFIRKLAEEKI